MRDRPTGHVMIGLCVLAFLGTRQADGADALVSTVGWPAKIEKLDLPGSELEAKTVDTRSSPIILRITEVIPHDGAFRYNFKYYGLHPGMYDLKDYLKRKDGTSTDDLPEIPVMITGILPPEEVESPPFSLKITQRLGSYRNLLTLGAIAWSAGLVLILYLSRRRRRDSEDQ